ncbi:MAG: ABC transporter permease [Firmicutes bacterium]|jgi:tungstate transport system permease protein|nr:ABC transporter permease [Bacillota bacterium]MBR0481061.1 ABC transporter permease [Bacillota bacterium]
MKTAIRKAIALILSKDAELLNVLATTARMSLSSSLVALLIGVPLGILLGSCKFRGKGVLSVINRTLMAMPPVVCGLIFYILFSGVGPLRAFHLMYTVRLMILAQIALITPIVAGNMESFVTGISGPVLESARGLGLSRGKTFGLLLNECVYQMFFAFLLAFSRAIAEVGAVSMVGGAIAWKTNVMTTSIMEYTNKGDMPRAMGLGLILMTVALIVNILTHMVEKKVNREK